jgi:hypothetical protein
MTAPAAPRLPIVGGLDGNVVVRPQVAFWFHHEFRQMLRDCARTNGRTWPDEVWAVADAFDKVARAHWLAVNKGIDLSTALRDSDGGMASRNDGEELSVAEYARRAKVTTKAIYARIKRDKGLAHRDDNGRLRISAENLLAEKRGPRNA